MFRPLIAAIALAAAGTGAVQAQSCTVVPISHETGSGTVSGYVLDQPKLCYFIDQTGLRGEARLHADNACFTAPGVGGCTNHATFNSGQTGALFYVEQQLLQVQPSRFTLEITLF